jgi:predicted nucleic acid-binding protein
MSKYCLDTNIISYLTGNYKDWSDYNTAKKNIISHLDKYQANEIVLTDITAVELKEWMKSYYEKASQKDYIWLQNLTESQKAKLRQFRKQNKLLQELQIYNPRF